MINFAVTIILLNNHNMFQITINRGKILIATTLLLFLFSSYSAQAQRSLGEFQRGEGVIKYTHYQPFRKQPINLCYYIPTKGNVRKMQVIISMPGSQRTAKGQLNAWKPLAEEYGFVVIVPEMLQENGYRNLSYRYGFVSRSIGNGEFSLRPRYRWVFQLIEEIFDFYREETYSRVKHYDLFGQSAGAQFVERFILTMPDTRCRRAVASNAGQYTYPDPTGLHHPDGTLCDHAGWPHSVSDTPFANTKHLCKVFKRDLTIHIGTKDLQDLHKRDKLVDTVKYKYNYHHIMGATRYQRAHHFYDYSKRVADSLGLKFNWRIVDNIGVGHGSTGAIYGRRKVPKRTLEDGTQEFDPHSATEHSAFQLLVKEKNASKRNAQKQK